MIAASMKGVDTQAAPFQFFAMQIDEFTIFDNNSQNSLVIGGVPIFVTFDERFDKAWDGDHQGVYATGISMDRNQSGQRC